MQQLQNLQQRVDTLEKSNQDLKQSNEELKKSNKDLKLSDQAIQEKVEDFEADLEADEEEADLDAEFERSLKIYGFSQFSHRHFDSDHENNILSDYPNYDLGEINLYFDFRFLPKWRFLVELSYTASPRGQRGRFDQTRLRATSNSRSAPSKETNGVGIERAWLAYYFHPLLNLTLGTYIPPHGIYKVDHASYVLPTVRVPIETSFPNKLTGLKISGRWETRKVILSYSAYTANGTSLELNEDFNETRAPETERDLDFDKAYGGNLRLALKTTKWIKKAFVGRDI